jgi:hypothetical protein
VRCEHVACGAKTRIRLPAAVPLRAVRRVVCDGCHQAFDCRRVEEVAAEPRGGAARAGATVGDALRSPPGRLWAWISVPLAALAVLALLTVLVGDDGDADGGPPAPAATAPGSDAAPGSGTPVRERGYTAMIPPGWSRSTPPEDASFAAEAEDGSADATLWVSRDPSLSLGEFEATSLAQLRAAAGSARVLERTGGPSEDSTVVRLRADAPAGEGESIAYEVTLRASGPLRYYLATSVEHDASPQARLGAARLHETFSPEPTADG